MTDGILTGADMADFRALAQSAMQTPCAVVRKSQTQSGSGGMTNTWAVASSPSLLCRVSAVTTPGEEVVAAAREEARAQWLIRLPAGTVVLPADRLVTTAAPGVTFNAQGIASSGTTYEIDKVDDQRTYQAEVLVYCWRIS